MPDINAVYDQVVTYLSETDGMVGTFPYVFLPSIGASGVMVEVGEFQDGLNTLVAVTSVVLTEVPVSPDLHEFVALHVSHFSFGSLMLVPDTTPGLAALAVYHPLLGDFLDQDELGLAIIGVSQESSYLADMMQAKFGGKFLKES